MVSQPLVSVLIPNHNYSAYLPLAIKSVLRQTYQHFEMIICDDGSTDNSWEVLQACTDDPRIKITRKSRGGQPSAWSAAYQLAEGEILCFLDSDDAFRPAKLAEVVHAFKANPQSGICTHFLRPVSKRGRPLGAPVPRILDCGWLAPTALNSGGKGNYPPSSGISVRNEIAELVFPIPEYLSRAPDAYAFNTAIFLTQVVAIPQVLGDYRWHGKNICAGKIPNFELLTGLIDVRAKLHQAVVAFLTSRFGREVARCVRLEDSESYRKLLLWLYVFEGQRNGYVRHHDVDSILGQLSPGFKNVIRKILISLPPRLAQTLYRAWARMPYLLPWRRSLKIRTLT
ncbi:MAG: glycosyltransferase family 2 protein [Fidelibacterota bacterium]|nr:MAG: glycosyltransferase family 2 protein [Candidatus Neomarinimicrobiota bacterium]